MARVPCHLIVGPNGSGKTTLLCKSVEKRGDTERIGVVSSSPRPEGLTQAALWIQPIEGGCLCCSTGGWESALARMMTENPVDRIIVESSGLTLMEVVTQRMSGVCQRLGLQWCPPMAVFDPMKFRKKMFESLPYYQQLIEYCGIIVANRCDLSSSERLEDFLVWSSELSSSGKTVLMTSYGDIDTEIWLKSKSKSSTLHAGKTTSSSAKPLFPNLSV